MLVAGNLRAISKESLLHALGHSTNPEVYITKTRIISPSSTSCVVRNVVLHDLSMKLDLTHRSSTNGANHLAGNVTSCFA